MSQQGKEQAGDEEMRGGIMGRTERRVHSAGDEEGPERGGSRGEKAGG